MGNELPCCYSGRSKIPQAPLSRPVQRAKGSKQPKASTPLDSEALQSIHPRRTHALYTPHMLLKLLRMDLIQKAYLLQDLKPGASLTFFVSAVIEEKRKEKLTDATIRNEIIRPPKYDLIRVSSLPVGKQRDLAWVLSQYKEVEGEKLDGFLEVKKVSRFGIPRQRLAIFSTEALYICEAANIRAMKRRIKWSDLTNITLSQDDRSVKLEVSNSSSQCILHTPHAPDIVNAIKTLYHLKFSQFPSVTMSVNKEEIRLLGDLEENYKKELCRNVLQKYGSPQEEVVKCLEVGTLDAKRHKEKMTILVSTLCLYRTADDSSVHSIIPLHKVSFIGQIDDLTQILVQSALGDYWIIHLQVKWLAEQIQKLHLAVCGNAVETQDMTFAQGFEMYHPKPLDKLVGRRDHTEDDKKEGQYYTLGEVGKAGEAK